MRRWTTLRPQALTAAAAVVLAVLFTACAAGHPQTAHPPRAGAPAPASPAATPRTIKPTYHPVINPAEFSTTIDNPYFPLVPGTRLIYQGATPEGTERNVVEVTSRTKSVMGVQTREVHDLVSVNGKPTEETFDWYAQDTHGNVWYFGEATKKLSGSTVNTSGSFVAGVDGALPGIIMEAQPVIGDQYRQEYYQGQAEDIAKVLSLTGTEHVPFGGTHSDLLVTEDINPLDPTAAVENKYFAKGVGFLLAVHVTGPTQRLELVAVERF